MHNLTEDELLQAILAEHPRAEGKRPEQFNLPRKLCALDEPLRTIAARGWLASKSGKEWAHSYERNFEWERKKQEAERDSQ